MDTDFRIERCRDSTLTGTATERYRTKGLTSSCRYLSDTGLPTDTVERFLGLLEPLAESARRLYPGWRMRIYHNVTEEDRQVRTHGHTDTRTP